FRGDGGLHHRAQQHRRRQSCARPRRRVLHRLQGQARLRARDRGRARPDDGAGRVHGRRPAGPDRAARSRLRGGASQRAPLAARPGPLGHPRARRRRRGARAVRPDPARAGPGRGAAAGRPEMNWRLALVVALLAGAALSGWLLLHAAAPEPGAAEVETRSDFVLHDFEVVTLDSSGQESFSLRAPELRQTPGARTLELATPLFLMPDEHDSRWEVRSQTGWINEKSTLVQLRGGVVADSPMRASRPTVLRTAALDVYPPANRATSDVVVTITSPGTTMRGTGMEADLAGKRIQLLSRVTLTNDPNHR